MKRLCTICARGGSKGVKNKNLRNLAGLPLIAHSILQAKASELFDYIAVSSDSDDILAAAKKWGADYLIKRPDALATDQAPKLPVIQHCVEEAERLAETEFNIIVDLDATSPLREPEDIVQAVKLLQEKGVANVITGAPARRSPYFNLVELNEQGYVGLSKPPTSAVVRRQDSPKCFDMNASVYVWRREALFDNLGLFKGDTLIYVMPEERSIDIDSELDFEFVQFLMEKKSKQVEQKKYHQLFSLKGKNAIVTGGVGILGRRFCSGLGEFGANVAVVDLDEAAAKMFASELKEKYNIKAIGIGCDVSSAQSVKKMVQRVVREFGKIDILHNNAAGKSSDLSAFFESFENYSEETWREIMSVNLDGMYLVAQAVGKHMVEQGTGGSIIQTSSIYGIMAPDNRIYKGSFYLNREINTPAVYSASKAAVGGLTKYLATYWADKGIRVNTIVPGGVQSGQNEEFIKNYSARIPLGRMAQGDEMVGALIYLASDASSYVTGQSLIVDGGLSAW